MAFESSNYFPIGIVFDTPQSLSRAVINEAGPWPVSIWNQPLITDLGSQASGYRVFNYEIWLYDGNDWVQAKKGGYLGTNLEIEFGKSFNNIKKAKLVLIGIEAPTISEFHLLPELFNVCDCHS